MLIAVGFFSMMGLAVKFVSHLPAIQVVFFRSIISFIISFTTLKANRVSPWGENHKFLVLRGVCGAMALILFFHVIQEIPLASAVVLGYLAPLFSTLLGVFIVKEKVTVWQWLFFATSFFGILLVEGFDPRVPLLYIGLGTLGSFFSGLAQNFIRKINTKEHPLVIVFYFPLVTTPITLLYCIFVEWVTPVGTDWLFLLAIGLLTQFAQYFMTKSIQLEEISKVSVLRYTSIGYALFFGFFFFDETYDWVAYLGMTLTIGGVAANLWYKRAKSKG